MTSGMAHHFDIRKQEAACDSPWGLRVRILIQLWGICWAIFCSWTPKPLNAWRLMWLRLFGATVSGTPFVHQRARIAMPWNLTLRNRSCLGDRTNAYSLSRIEIGEHATVAQEAYLCTGTHDIDHHSFGLKTADISIGAHAFVGARAFILPGVTVGEGAVVGACSLVTGAVAPWTVNAGNPCRQIRERTIRERSSDHSG